MTSRETLPAFYRPSNRRLSELTNEELRQLFDLRAKKIYEELDPKGFWENNKIVYWHGMIPTLEALYEVMLEIQSRYPKNEIVKYSEHGPYFNQLLPLNEEQWIDMYIDIINYQRSKIDSHSNKAVKKGP